MSIGTVSLLTQPDQYTTVNAINGSHLYYQAVSASASVAAFQYIFNVYEIDQLAQTVEAYVGQFDIPPRPITGDGIFTPYRALQSYVNNEPIDFQPTQLGIIHVSASIVEYQTTFGYSYNPNYFFTTFNLVAGPNLLGLTFSYIPDDIHLGSQITLLMNTNQFNPQYNTTMTVFGFTLSGGGDSYLVTNQPYGMTPLVGLTESGYITNIQNLVGTGSTAWAWDGTRQYTETQNFNPQFVLNAVSNFSGGFLTNYNNYSLTGGVISPTFSMKPTLVGQYETMGFIADPSAAIRKLNISMYDINGVSVFNQTQTLATMSYPYRKYEMGVGTQNLIDAYGVSFTGVAYYQLTLEPSIGPNRYAEIWRRIDGECQYCFYPNFQLTWLNQRGSYEYFNFYKDSMQMITVNTNEIRKVLPWNYTIGDRERTILSQQAQVSYKLNTNWISQYDYNWLYQELLFTVDAYLVDPQNPNQRIPIIITDKQGSDKTYARDQLFNFTITYEYASLQNIQSN